MISDSPPRSETKTTFPTPAVSWSTTSQMQVSQFNALGRRDVQPPVVNRALVPYPLSQVCFEDSWKREAEHSYLESQMDSRVLTQMGQGGH